MGVYQNLVGGRWSDPRSGRWKPDINPARSSEVLAEFPETDPSEVEEAVGAAQRALPGWRRMGIIARGEILFRAAELLLARADQIGRDLTREEGKTFAEGKGETLRAAAILRYFAGESRQEVGEVYSAADPTTLLYTRREPVGVVGVITPWNFPIAIPAWKIAPALIYGNTVVWKPADLTPLTAYHLAQALQEAGLPDGVLNLLFGRGSVLGSAIVNDRRVNAVSFTGSNSVGKGIAAACASRGAKYQLELGGKNSVVVLADADLDLAVEMTLRGAMKSTGQKCTATSRVIVEQPMVKAFTEAFAERCRTVRVGDPLEPETYMGPLASEQQQQTVLEYVRLGQQEGARLVTGGGRLDIGGFFVPPTVFTDVAPEMQIAREEIFGPVVTIIPATDVDQAFALSNQSNFGLSTALFTRDLGRALAYVEEAEAGIIHINSETAGAEPHVPFGGMKESSSYSREQGKSAREFFTQIKTVYLDRPVMR